MQKTCYAEICTAWKKIFVKFDKQPFTAKMPFQGIPMLVFKKKHGLKFSSTQKKAEFSTQPKSHFFFHTQVQWDIQGTVFIKKKPAINWAMWCGVIDRTFFNGEKKNCTEKMG